MRGVIVRILSMHLLQFLAIGFVAGWIMGRVRQGKGYGILGNLLIGAIGALVGGFIGGFLGIAPGNILASVAMAVLGAVVFFLIVDAVRPKKKRGASGDKDDE